MLLENYYISLFKNYVRIVLELSSTLKISFKLDISQIKNIVCMSMFMSEYKTRYL